MSDPTRTLTLRNKTISEINRRYNELKGLVNASIVHNRAFHVNADPLPPDAFSGLDRGEAIAAWNVWLAETINEVILDVPPKTPLVFTPPFETLQTQWLVASILEGYRRGAVTEHRNLKRTIDVLGVISLANPLHTATTRIIAASDYTALKGITRTMADQMTQVLAQGLIEGKGAAEIARNINNRVDKIGKVRSRLLARTEIVNAYNQASINEDEIAEGVVGEEIVEKWITAGDERVRTSHVGRDGNFYSKKRARALVGEPNCRCNIVGVPLSRVPPNRKILR